MAKGYGYGYGKRPLWQWVVIYVVAGAIVYGAIYYFVWGRNGGYNYGGNGAPTYNSGTNNNYGTQ